MWAQTWDSIFPIVKPFPNKKFVDASKTMLEKVSHISIYSAPIR